MRVWVVQCKHKRAGRAGSVVGTPVLHRVNGTARPVHKADVVVAVTNGRLASTPAGDSHAGDVQGHDHPRLARWRNGRRVLAAITNSQSV